MVGALLLLLGSTPAGDAMCVLTPGVCYGVEEWKKCVIPEGACLRLPIGTDDHPDPIIEVVRVITRPACKRASDESLRMETLNRKAQEHVQATQDEPITFQRERAPCAEKRAVEVVIVKVRQ